MTTRLAVGLRAVRERVFTGGDLAAYRSLCGDVGLGFGESPGVPGPLLAGMISDMLGTELPGEGTMWMKQKMTFPAAAPPGVSVAAAVEITRLRPDKGLVDLDCRCRVDDVVVLEGRSLVLVPDLADRVEPISAP